MLGDSIVYIAAAAMLLFIPACFRIARAAEARAGRASAAEWSCARTLAVLILGTFTLTGGVLAALFGGTWWLSPLGSVVATAVVGAMLCAIVALTSVPAAATRSTRVTPARPAQPLRRAA
ncbi:MAG: hypothetical protein IT436_07405 [Phycisphaerales bacterium]|nr:hypothetical protein [Phycisphaerales bacterium]